MWASGTIAPLVVSEYEVVLPPPPPPPDPCGITDTFTRTVSGGWGISDAGMVWIDSYEPGSYGGVVGGGSVSGGEGIATHTSLVRYYLKYFESFVVDSAFSFSGTFSISALPENTLPPGGWSSSDGFGFEFYNYVDGEVATLQWGWTLVDGVHYDSSYNTGYGVYRFESHAGQGVLKTITPNVEYAFKFDVTATLVRAKMWVASETEPSSWDFSDAYAVNSAPTGVQWYSQQMIGYPLPDPDRGFAQEKHFDDFSIGGVNICNGITDTFTRVVGVGWGTSDSGQVWTWDADGGPGTEIVSVANGAGTITTQAPVNGFNLYEWISLSDGSWPVSQDFDIRFTLTVNDIDVEHGTIPWFDFEAGTCYLGYEGGLVVEGGRELTLAAGRVGAPYYYFATLTPFLFTEGVAYKVRFSNVFGSWAGAKIWLATDPEPEAWTLYTTCPSQRVRSGTPYSFAIQTDCGTDGYPDWRQGPLSLTIDDLRIAGIS